MSGLDLPVDGDEDIFFAAEEEVQEPKYEGFWDTMIVDDEVEVHNVTRLALDDFVFDNKRLNFISAHSGAEARELIAKHPETAVILLDVVMEEDDAGLRFVRTLREEMDNKLVRIILRTGQPGQAPEQRVIVDYDINDYKTKPELTSQKLFTTMVVALRSFRDLHTIEESKRELEQLNDTLEDRVVTRTQALAKANRELRDTQTQLVQTSRMASLGKLVAGVAHEINTPIASVSSSQSTLQTAVARIRTALEKLGEPDRKVLSYLRVIDESSEVIELGAARVAAIVNRLRSFARLDQAELKHVDIHDCINDTLGLLSHELRDVTVHTEFAELPTLVCYPARLNQVFFNVLSNAVEAGAGRISLVTTLAGEKVRLTLTDDGPGIETALREQVFDPGFTTKGGGVGTGLGLSICFQIVSDHGGSIYVEEGPEGRGSSFVVEVPLERPPAPK
jgi:two-component system NtrC family sensor kinase